MGPTGTARAERLFQEAVALHRGGRLGPAIAAYRRVTELMPEHIGAHCNLGIALRKAGRAYDAIACYRRALALDPGLADIHFNLGTVLATLAQYAPAIEAFRRAAALKPGFAEAYNSLGNMLSRSGQEEEAVEAYRRAVEAKPDHVGALGNLGIALEKTGRHDEAARALQDALAVDPGRVSAMGHLASVLAALGRQEEAAATARRGLALEAADSDALAGLAAALTAPERTGNGAEERIGELIGAYRTAIAAKPDASDAAVALAELHLERGDPGAALEVVEECLARLPRDVWCLALKCTLLNELGDREGLNRLADFDRLIQVKRWDAVPEYGQVARLNAALAEHVLGHPSLVYQPDNKATRQGHHSGNLLVPPKGPMGALELMIREMVEKYVPSVGRHGGNPLLANPPERWSLNIWAVVMKGQGHQIPHVHPSAWLSGVYYPTVPEAVRAEGGSEEEAGWLQFGRPFLRHRTAAPPRLRTIRPVEGLMVLFPPYFLHSTVPFRSEETRISIAFDVTPVA